MHFAFTIGFGFALSFFWFLLHFTMTQVHSVDSEIINHTGRLRFMTQRLGVLLLERMVLPLESQSDQAGTPQQGARMANLQGTFDLIDALCRQLLGEEAEPEGAPEMLDRSVKAALQEWIDIRLEPIRVLAVLPVNATRAASVILKVDEATMAIDTIVDLASAGSDGRVDVLLAISYCRALLGVVWTTCTVLAFGRVWRPFVSTYNELQNLKQQKESLLRAAFDVIIKVSPKEPFDVIEDSKELGHLMSIKDGAVRGRSLLSFTVEPDRDLLTNFLSRELHTSKLPEYSKPVTWWWNLVPMSALGKTEPPVAPAIRCRWCSDADQVLGVEALVVGSFGTAGTAGHGALLALKLVSGSAPPTLRGLVDVIPEATLANHGDLVNIRLGNPFPQPMRGSDQQAQSPARSVARTSSAGTLQGRGLFRLDMHHHSPTRSYGHTSSAETTHAPVMGGNGAISPRSELNDTPPPTVFGAPMRSLTTRSLGTGTTNSEVGQAPPAPLPAPAVLPNPTSVDHRLAAELQARLGASVSSAQSQSSQEATV